MGKHKKPKPPAYEIIEGRSSPMVRVQASTWRHLLEVSATALGQLLRSPDASAHPEELPKPSTMLSVELHLIDFDAMLEAWLNELLHLGRRHSMVFTAFEILQLDLEADCKLTAMIEGSQASTELTHRIDSVGSPAPRTRNHGQRIECEIRFRTSSV